jgi:hypothetical protein
MQPINYLAQVADPFAQAAQGYKLGATIVDVEAKRAELARQQQLQQQQQQQLAQEQARFFANPNPTMRDAARFASILSPEQSKAFLPYMEGISKEQQQGVLKSTGQILSALQVNPETGIKILRERAVAARNGGDEDDASLFERIADAAADPARGPAMAFKALVQNTSMIPGAKEMFENIDKGLGTARAEAKAPAELTKAQAEAEKAAIEAAFAERLQQAGLDEKNWNVKNLRSQISDRSARLNLDQQTTAATVAEKLSSIQKNLNDIPADTRKLINESAVTAATSKQSADQFNDLAKRIESAGGNYGVASSASDFLKKVGGFQGGMTQLKQEYTRLRNTAAIKSLPPGPATDKDIAMALSGFPSDTARADDLARFLRGMAKLQDVDASISNAKTDWLAQNNGTLTRAKNTFVAGDYSTKPGETFNDFAQRIVGDVSKRYNPATQSPLVEQIPTPRTPAPMAAQNNIRSQADAILRGGQ